MTRFMYTGFCVSLQYLTRYVHDSLAWRFSVTRWSKAACKATAEHSCTSYECFVNSWAWQLTLEHGSSSWNCVFVGLEIYFTWTLLWKWAAEGHTVNAGALRPWKVVFMRVSRAQITTQDVWQILMLRVLLPQDALQLIGLLVGQHRQLHSEVSWKKWSDQSHSTSLSLC